MGDWRSSSFLLMPWEICQKMILSTHLFFFFYHYSILITTAALQGEECWTCQIAAIVTFCWCLHFKEKVSESDDTRDRYKREFILRWCMDGIIFHHSSHDKCSMGSGTNRVGRGTCWETETNSDDCFYQILTRKSKNIIIRLTVNGNHTALLSCSTHKFLKWLLCFSAPTSSVLSALQYWYELSLVQLFMRPLPGIFPLD